MSVDAVYRPFVFVPKEEKRSNELPIPEVDRRVFSILSHLMGPQRRWGGIDGRLIPSDSAGRIPGMGAAGMAPEELRVRRFMESCTFKAMFSCAGGISSSLLDFHSLLLIRIRLGHWSRCVHGEYRSDVDHPDFDPRGDALAERCLERNANEVDELREEFRHRRTRLQHRGM